MTRESLRKLATLSLRELVELAQAQLELVAAQFLVSTRSTGRLISTEAADATALATQDSPDPRAERIAVAVNRAADHGPFHPRCLVRAIATNRMLERRGIRGSRIRIGVRRAQERFVAHAWVEYGGRVIGDSNAHVESFSELTDVRLVKPK